jgi:hypothetical protein
MKTTIEWTQCRLADGTLLPGYTFSLGMPESLRRVSQLLCARNCDSLRDADMGPSATTTRRIFGDKHWTV